MRTSDRWIIIFLTILSGSFSRTLLCFWATDVKIIYAYARWYIKMALEQQEKSKGASKLLTNKFEYIFFSFCFV